MLNKLLESKKCFKLICAAGNEDCEQVSRLVYLYSLAGCKFFDVSANENVVTAAKNALKKANINDAYICVSISSKGDSHTNKAVINYEKCINCGSCESICPQDAIHYAKIKKEKCIGCSRCASVCPRQAISYINEDKKPDEILPPIINNGIDCIEFHVVGQDREEILSKWEFINKIFGGMLSISINRGFLGNEDFLSLIKEMIKDRTPYSTIMQADGLPMSGGADDFKTTLQSVATAEIVQSSKLPVYLMLSGGTNSKTAELAKLCAIDYNAVAFGSFARKIVKNYLQRPDFWSNDYIIDEAVRVASDLVNTLI